MTNRIRWIAFWGIVTASVVGAVEIAKRLYEVFYHHA